MNVLKYLPLVYHNVMRNKIRSLFTGASIAASLFLVVTLYSLLSSGEEIANKTEVHHRVAVLNEAGLAGRVPIVYVSRIRKVPGVVVATPFSWFGGNYRDERANFAQFGVDPQAIFSVYEEYEIPPDELKAWQDDRTGCVVGSQLADHYGWKVGDKIPLQGSIYPVSLELTVRGIYSGPVTANKDWLLFNFDYLDEALKGKFEERSGNAGIVMLRAESKEKADSAMQQIEEAFASSDAPVKPMTEKAFGQSFAEMVGNVQGFIRYTSLAVVAALLCVAGNTMAMSLRERTREIALLKAIGFSRGTVLGMFLSESIVIGLLGGVAGALGAKLLFDAIDISKFQPQLAMFYVPWSTALWGLGLSAFVGLFSGIIPAWRAANLSVVEGLRRVV
jgi:putative ABC transport system permease protein